MQSNYQRMLQIVTELQVAGMMKIIEKYRKNLAFSSASSSSLSVSTNIENDSKEPLSTEIPEHPQGTGLSEKNFLPNNDVSLLSYDRSNLSAANALKSSIYFNVWKNRYEGTTF